MVGSVVRARSADRASEETGEKNDLETPFKRVEMPMCAFGAPGVKEDMYYEEKESRRSVRGTMAC